MAWCWITTPYEFGCCRRGCGAGNEGARNTANAGSANLHFGELVQLDGSFHDWLEGRGPRGCLMNMVDDATGRTVARLGKEETIWAAVGVLRAWMEQYGVPRALYTEWKNVYERKDTPAEQLRGQVPRTQ